MKRRTYKTRAEADNDSRPWGKREWAFVLLCAMWGFFITFGITATLVNR